MSLKDHPYRFFGQEGELLDLWRGTLQRLQGEACQGVYAVWDEEEEEFLRDAPFLAAFSWGVLMVLPRGGRLALGWNEMLPGDIPTWPDEGMRRYGIEGLAERQQLFWREYPPAAAARGQQIEQAGALGDARGLRGLWLDFAGGGRLCLKENGVCEWE